MEYLKGKKYVIEPRNDEEENKKWKIAPSDINEGDRLYKLWLRKIRRSHDWRPTKKVQKTDIFNGNPGIALVNNDKIVEKYGLQWVHEEAQRTTDDEDDL